MSFIKWFMNGFLAITVVWLAPIYYHSAYCWTGHVKPSHYKHIHTAIGSLMPLIGDGRRRRSRSTKAVEIHWMKLKRIARSEKKWHSVTQKVWAIWLLLSVLCYSSASRLLPSSVLSLAVARRRCFDGGSQYAQTQEPGQRCHAYASFKQV